LTKNKYHLVFLLLNLYANNMYFIHSAGTHGVAKIPTGECPASFAGPDIIQLAPDAADGTYVWTAKEPGVVWVACNVASHCETGQILKITVA
jgi:uncharacterized cupredoxin-like copper-binding protein